MHQGINTVTEKVEYLNDGIPIIQSKHITKGFLHFEGARFLSLEDYEKYNIKYQPKVDDLLVCNIGTIGKSLRIDKENQFLIAWNLFLIKIKKEQLYSSFFAHFLNYLDYHKYFDRFLTGGTVKFINKKTMGNIPIPLPPLEQQKKIAAILDAADTYRQKTKALITKYDALTQSLFLDMFGDPVRNPKGWERIKLEEIGTISSGSTPSRKNEENFNGDIPWVKTGEVNSKIILDTEEKISKTALSNSSCKLYPAGSLIIAMYGQGKTRGQVALLGIEASTNQACAVLTKSDKANFTFLYKLIQMAYSDLRSLGRGGNQPNLNSGILKKYLVINPPMELQNQFADSVKAIEAQKEQAQASLAQAENLFNSLLQRAFKGELV